MAGLFIKLDVDFWDHPKVVQAGLMPAVLYLRMTGYAMQHTTDGFVPAGQMPRFAMPATSKLTAALAAVGLIEQVEGGWMVPGYVERYRTAEEVAELRGKRAAAGRLGGRPRKQPESKLLSSGFDGEKANGNPEVEVEVEVEVEQPPPEVTPVPTSDTDAGVVAVADQLIADLGIVGEFARPDERRYVARALERGWTIEQLRDLAAEAISREDIDGPRDYLRGGLKNRANSDPTPTGPGAGPADTSDRASAWAQVAQIARRGPTDWRERTDLDARTRAAAHEARIAIRTLPADEARRQFLAAWAAIPAPTP